MADAPWMEYESLRLQMIVDSLRAENAALKAERDSLNIQLAPVLAENKALRSRLDEAERARTEIQEDHRNEIAIYKGIVERRDAALKAREEALRFIDSWWFDPSNEKYACAGCEANLHSNYMGRHGSCGEEERCPFQVAHDALMDHKEGK